MRPADKLDNSVDNKSTNGLLHHITWSRAAELNTLQAEQLFLADTFTWSNKHIWKRCVSQSQE